MAAGSCFDKWAKRTNVMARIFMKRVTLIKLFVDNQDEALEFYTKKLGFEVTRARRR
jgi:hypothetical protein